MPDDAFDILGLSPSAWLDADDITAAFHRRARNLHPDAPGGGDAAFSELNAARKTLADPAARLRLLIRRSGEAETVAGSPTADWKLAHGEVAFRIGPFLQRAAAFAQAEEPATQLQRAMRRVEISGLLKELQSARDAHDVIVVELETATRKCNEYASDRAALAELAERWTYAMRWSAQLTKAIRQCQDTV